MHLEELPIVIVVVAVLSAAYAWQPLPPAPIGDG